MLSQYSVTFGRLTVQAIGRHGSQRKKNVSTILQQVSLHMIFQRRTTRFLSQTADRILFMDGGVVVEEGPAKQLIDHPREQRTKQFLAHYAE